MAISKGNASKEAMEFKRYIGICPVTIKAINPNKREHEKLFNVVLEDNPVYIEDKEDSNGNAYKNARISIVFQADNEKVKFNMPLITMALYISNQKMQSTKSGKYQIVDKYGRFTWASEDNIRTKTTPTYTDKNGETKEFDIDINSARIAYSGEESLTEFIKTFLCIPNITTWNNESKSMVLNENVKSEECECRLEESTFEKIFKGDFSEIKEILGYQPTNKIKICLGIRTNPENGKLYQSVYTKKFLSNSSTNYNALNRAIQADITYAVSNGKAVNTEYSTDAVHEYSVEPTVFIPTQTTNNPTDDLPFRESEDDVPWV